MIAIPRVIHQIWHPFSAPEIPADWQRFSQSWKRLHPQHQHVLWGVDESRRFVATHYPALLPMYDEYEKPVQRVDVLRLLLLRHFGGVYVDLDVECYRNVEPMLAGQRVVFPIEPPVHAHAWRHKGHPKILSTAFIASVPQDPFWDHLLREVVASRHEPEVMDSTGPFAVTRAYESYEDRTTVTLRPAEVVYPLSEPECRDGSAYDIEMWTRRTAASYGAHHWASTWNRPGQSSRPASRPYGRGLPIKLRHPDFNADSPGRLKVEGPLVSCLMVSRGRSRPARWSIECFRQQSYANRELVVLTANPDGDIADYIESLQDSRIRFVGVQPASLSLGELRNVTLAHARGDIVATWDDDDLFGSDRLAAQMTALLSCGAAASFCERITIWWPGLRRIATSHRHHWENSMVAYKAALGSYPKLARAEDSTVIAALVARHPIVLIDDPNLYFYTFTGQNTWGATHFQRFVDLATFRIEGHHYDRALTVANKHFPVFDYLDWLRQQNPDWPGPVAPPVPALRTDTARRVPRAAGAIAVSATPPAGLSQEANSPEIPLQVAAPSVPGPSRPLSFLLAWELGGGLGHIVPLAQVARPLLEAGHQVHMVLLDLASARAGLGELFDHPRLRVWQAPLWQAPLTGAKEPACYAELLFRAGYLDAARLSGLVEAWASVFRQTRPDLLLCDHAPTALLAARAESFPCAVISNGFFTPPRRTPMPSFREWEPIPTERLLQSEGLALNTCNAILAERGQFLLRSLSQLLDAQESFLVTVPELDHFPQRDDVPGTSRYWGLLSGPSHGVAPTWSAGELPRVVVYLKSDYAPLAQVLAQLRDAPFRSLAYVAGLSDAARKEYASERLALSSHPLDMGAACREADLVLCQSGAGTVATALRAGRPVMMLPGHVEQLLVARRVEQMGAGLYLLDGQVGKLLASLRRLHDDPRFGLAAQRFAQRQPDGRQVAAAVAARCIELAAEVQSIPTAASTSAA